MHPTGPPRDPRIGEVPVGDPLEKYLMFDPSRQLRSPREVLGGYAVLPRLIDKVRLSGQGRLPDEYRENLLKQGKGTLDGRFMEFSSVGPDALREAILSLPDDRAVLDWVERNGRPHTDSEKTGWFREIVSDRPYPDRLAVRIRNYPEVASRFDVGAMNAFDLIDLDEGRRSTP